MTVRSCNDRSRRLVYRLLGLRDVLTARICSPQGFVRGYRSADCWPPPVPPSLAQGLSRIRHPHPLLPRSDLDLSASAKAMIYRLAFTIAIMPARTSSDSVGQASMTDLRSESNRWLLLGLLLGDDSTALYLFSFKMFMLHGTGLSIRRLRVRVPSPSLSFPLALRRISSLVLEETRLLHASTVSAA